MHAQVLRSLHLAHAAFLDQPHSLKLELAGKSSSLHDPPPVPSSHLTRCLWNRVQATKRILALDGGGIRGILTLEYLSAIESMLRKRSGRDDFLLCDYFD